MAKKSQMAEKRMNIKEIGEELQILNQKTQINFQNFNQLLGTLMNRVNALEIGVETMNRYLKKHNPGYEDEIKAERTTIMAEMKAQEDLFQETYKKQMEKGVEGQPTPKPELVSKPSTDAVNDSKTSEKAVEKKS